MLDVAGGRKADISHELSSRYGHSTHIQLHLHLKLTKSVVPKVKFMPSRADRAFNSDLQAMFICIFLRITATLRLICVDPRAHEEEGSAASTLRSLPKWKAKRRRKEQQDEKRRQAPQLLSRIFNEELLSELGERDRQRVVLLVAMHPDQATEDVVEAGLRNGIPFAVVPCCVFAHLDPRRPTTYEGFLEYLAAKNAGVRRARLNFRGRDTVLYWKGSRD